MPFFFISAPLLLNSSVATVKQIKQVIIRKGIADGAQITLERDKFKTTNLDTLMFCNDKMLKLEFNVEGFLKKVDKQYLDLEGKLTHQWVIKSLDREVPIKRYCYEFKWNDAKYPRNFPISKVVEFFELKINAIETELRAKITSFNETKLQLSQNTQKDGNYNVKDLRDVLVEPLVKMSDFLGTKFIATLVAIVPVMMTDQFLQNYELLTENVIPYSARRLKVPDKDGLAIWTINIFNHKFEEQVHEEEEHHKKEKRVMTPSQQFIEKCREKLKITVKEFTFDGKSDERKKKKDSLQMKLKIQTKAVSEVCLAYFSEIYELYIHIKMTRLLIETNMRFGNDPTVLFCIETVPGKEKIVQGLLVASFGDKDSEGLYGTKDEIDDGEDFFPFIYVPGITF